jgi:hypothetical protein
VSLFPLGFEGRVLVFDLLLLLLFSLRTPKEPIAHAYTLTRITHTHTRTRTQYARPRTLTLSSPTAPCEQPSLTSYYNSLLTAPCLQIPMLQNWKCFDLNAPAFPPIGGTQALVIIIILFWFGAYWFHMRTFGGHGLDLLLPLLEPIPFVGPLAKRINAFFSPYAQQQLK